MKPPPIEYAAPSTLDEALSLLHARGDEAKVLAGGQSLMPLLSMRLARPSLLVDLNRVSGLAYIRRDSGHLAVGALTRQRDLETSALAGELVPLLVEAVRQVGHVAIRNRGTVGGSVAHADPAAELPAAVAALSAELVVAGPGGSRSLPPEEFFATYLTTALAPDEILTEIRVPISPPGAGYAVEELARRHHDFALAATFALVALDGDGRCSEARVGIAGASPVPLRPREAEDRLIGEVPTGDTIAAAARAAAQAASPQADVHAPAEYRRHLVEVLTRRALQRAVERAQGVVA